MPEQPPCPQTSRFRPFRVARGSYCFRSCEDLPPYIPGRPNSSNRMKRGPSEPSPALTAQTPITLRCGQSVRKRHHLASRHLMHSHDRVRRRHLYRRHRHRPGRMHMREPRPAPADELRMRAHPASRVPPLPFPPSHSRARYRHRSGNARKERRQELIEKTGRSLFGVQMKELTHIRSPDQKQMHQVPMIGHQIVEPAQRQPTWIGQLQI